MEPLTLTVAASGSVSPVTTKAMVFSTVLPNASDTETVMVCLPFWRFRRTVAFASEQSADVIGSPSILTVVAFASMPERF